MANFTLSPSRIPGFDPGEGARIINAIRRGTIKVMPHELHRYDVAYTDLAASATTATSVLNTAFTNRKFPANVFVRRAWVDVKTAFSGGSVSATRLAIGVSGAIDSLLPSQNVFTGSTGRLVPLINGGKFVHRVTKTFADLAGGASATRAVSLATFPTKAHVSHAIVNQTVVPTSSSGDTTSLTIQVGDAGDTDELLTVSGNLIGGSTGLTALGATLGAIAGRQQYESAYAPEALFTAAGGAPDVNHINAGAWTFDIFYDMAATALGFQSALEPVATLTTVGGNTNTLTAGRAFIYFQFAALAGAM